MHSTLHKIKSNQIAQEKELKGVLRKLGQTSEIASWCLSPVDREATRPGTHVVPFGKKQQQSISVRLVILTDRVNGVHFG